MAHYFDPIERFSYFAMRGNVYFEYAILDRHYLRVIVRRNHLRVIVSNHSVTLGYVDPMKKSGTLSGTPGIPSGPPGAWGFGANVSAA